MPVRQKAVAFADKLGEFLIALVHHWLGFVAGGVVMGVILNLYERFIHPISPGYYLGMLLVGFLVAAFLAWSEEHDKREKLQEDPLSAHRGASPDEWSVDFGGEVADIRILDATESRYAIALDVLITNRSAKLLSLSAQLLVQWAHPIQSRVARVHEVPIPRWDDILMAFNLTCKKQLLFPLDLATGSVSGHIVFDIDLVGIGATFPVGDFIGGLREDEEGERVRQYRLVLIDTIMDERKELSVRSVVAPRIDRSGVVNQTDLAVAGNASTFVLPQDADVRDDVLFRENLRLRQEVEKLSPRRLRPEQRIAIIARLRPEIERWSRAGHIATVHVAAAPGCGDCGMYARDFEDVFQSLGMNVLPDFWDNLVTTYADAESLRDRDDLRSGLTIRYSSEWANEHGPYVQAAIEAVGAAKIDVRVLDRAGTFFDFVVGSRE